MSIAQTGIRLAAILTIATLAGTTLAQECQSCLETTTIGGFGYPARIHHGGGGLLHKAREFKHDVHQHIEHLGAIHDVVSRRNKAWPKPFACADRQQYFMMWDAMLDDGWRLGCVFTDDHFAYNSDELNQAGQAKLAAIMKNNAIGQKAFYVQRSASSDLAKRRLTAVRTTVEKWYGLEDVTEIAYADRLPMLGDGNRTEIVNQLNIDGMPAPVIPVASGTGSTSDVQSGN